MKLRNLLVTGVAYLFSLGIIFGGFWLCWFVYTSVLELDKRADMKKAQSEAAAKEQRRTEFMEFYREAVKNQNINKP